MKFAGCVAGLLGSVFVHADSCTLSAARFGGEVVMIGDSERAVLEKKPERRVTLQNRFGAHVGVRYEFSRLDKRIEIVVRRGRVTRICHIDR